MILTHNQARTLMLAAQGLAKRPSRPATKDDVLRTIRLMGALQIDTIHVVARSPYLVLWSRLGSYEPRWLDELLTEGALFEYWSHEACFLPIEAYPLYRPRMINARTMGWKYPLDFVESNQAEIRELLEVVRENGPVRAADFERQDGKAGGWWEWKTEKRALEALFTSGELMISSRRNFHRVYDLRERVLPSWSDDQTPSFDEANRQLALSAVRALGISKPRWVADYFRTNIRDTVEAVRALVEDGSLIAVEVEGWEEPALIHPDNRRLVDRVIRGRVEPTLTTLLSPFDPTVWDRARTRYMFEFDYKLECYKPESARLYGYFVLPILHRGKLVGRLDAKAYRKEKLFEVRSIFFEPGVTIEDELISGVALALKECARWHNTPSVAIRRSEPRGVAARLRRALKT
jgi:uncharacterized protein YcaQ